MKNKKKFIAVGLCFVLAFTIIGATSESESKAAEKRQTGYFTPYDDPETSYEYDLSNYTDPLVFIEDFASGAEMEILNKMGYDGDLEDCEFLRGIKIGSANSKLAVGDSYDLEDITPTAIDVTETFFSDSGFTANQYYDDELTEDQQDKFINSKCRLDYTMGSKTISFKFSDFYSFYSYNAILFGNDGFSIKAISDKDYTLTNGKHIKNGTIRFLNELDAQSFIDDFKAEGLPYPAKYTIEVPQKFTINNAGIKTKPSMIYAGGTKQTTAIMALTIPASIKPYVKSTTFKTSNPKVATVNSLTGKITAKAKGTADISAVLALTDGQSKTFTQRMTVKNATMSFAKKKITIKKKKKKTVTVKLKGHDPAKVKWKTSNKKIAKITKKTKTGKVTIKGMKKGKAKITASIKVSSKKTVKKTFTVVVK